MKRAPQPPIYGLLAEFDDPHALTEAVHRTRAEGYRKIDAFTPYPVEEVWEALGVRDHRLPAIVLLGGVLGGIAGYALQYWTSVVEFPINVGGRPFHSWPAFIIPTFETTILGASLATVLGMFALNGLPMPYHPLFNVPRFALSSRDRFFLVIESTDWNFDLERTRAFLRGLGARTVTEVEH
jgi:hypothetical protein